MFIIDLIVLFIGLIGLLYFYKKNEPDNINDSLLYKLYLFIFVFLSIFITSTVSYLMAKETINYEIIMEYSVNNAMLAIIAYATYDNLIYHGFYKDYSPTQQMFMLIYLIILFIAVVKMVQLFIDPNLIQCSNVS